MVEPFGAEQNDPRLGFVQQPRQAWPLDDVALPLGPRRDQAFVQSIRWATLAPSAPASRDPHGSCRVKKGGPRPGHAPGRGCRQPPTPAVAGASPRARGSSPVSVLNAAGICRRRATPSFWRSTSQCAFAVRAEMPSLSPTSSFEQPSAISTTTCTWRSVSVKSAPFRFFIMPARLRGTGAADHRPMGVFAGTYTFLEPRKSPSTNVRETPASPGVPSSPALHPRRAEAAADEARLVPTGVRLVELILRESADP